MVNIMQGVKRRLDYWLIPDSTKIRRQYHRQLGIPLDLANPTGFHQKICWLRLYRTTPLHSYCADKITVAAYAASRIGTGHTARRYFTTTNPRELCAENIPARRCVIKANHESQFVIMVDDTTTADWDSIRRQMAARLTYRFYAINRERQYKSISPAIIVEEVFEETPGAGAGDLNIYCVAGKARFCLFFGEGDIKAQRPAVPMTVDWAPLAVTRKIGPFGQGNPPRPHALDRMLAFAERLAEPLGTVRVDYLVAGDRFCVNELTFSPFAGYNAFVPERFEREMGDLIDIAAPPVESRAHIAAARAMEAQVLPPRR